MNNRIALCGSERGNDKNKVMVERPITAKNVIKDQIVAPGNRQSSRSVTLNKTIIGNERKPYPRKK